MNEDYASVRNVEIDQGSFITSTQGKSLAKVAVLGPTTVTDLFGENATAADAIGQQIRIKGIVFTITGVTVAKGGSGFTNADDIIYIPLTTAARYFAGDEYLTSLYVQATAADSMTQVQEDLTSLLLTRHKISDRTTRTSPSSIRPIS